MAARPSVEQCIAGVLAGDRTLLAQAITRVESNHPAHIDDAEAIVAGVIGASGRSERVGITGVPGVGKSTFIESLGMQLLEQGRRVAVLAVDPSSPSTHGSILGDKTRMNRLAVERGAFIRPTPSGGSLGGVGRKTRETILLCEAAGFDTVIVETVGVGQSELIVSSMVDFFLVLLLPGAGDELQGIKRGIIELADGIAVNKADGDAALRAELARREYSAALHYLRRDDDWAVPVVTCSGQTGQGVAGVWEMVVSHRRQSEASGWRDRRRSQQQERWMWSLVEEDILQRVRREPSLETLVESTRSAVCSGGLSATAGARRILRAFWAR